MGGYGKRVAVIAAVLFAGLFIVFVVNQSMQLVFAADRISPLFGRIVLWFLVGFYTFAFVMFVWNFLRLPKALRAPTSTEGPEFEAFLNRLRRRLKENPRFVNRPLEKLSDVEEALEVLGEEADHKTREAALQAFFVTAISQNGNLDAFAVMTIHARLVYDVARLYWQRPTMRDLVYLYSNVAVSAIIARQLDDWDMTEYVTPIINASMGSAIGAVPGATAVASVAVQAVVTGSANAYMTLRVGIIAKRYCSSVTVPDRRQLRDGAFVEAAKMFPGVVSYGTKKVFQILGNAAVKGTRTAVTAVGSGVKDVATKTASTVKDAGEAVAKAARNLADKTGQWFGREAAEEAAAGREE